MLSKRHQELKNWWIIPFKNKQAVRPYFTDPSYQEEIHCTCRSKIIWISTFQEILVIFSLCQEIKSLARSWQLRWLNLYPTRVLPAFCSFQDLVRSYSKELKHLVVWKVKSSWDLVRIDKYELSYVGAICGHNIFVEAYVVSWFSSIATR